MVVPGITSSVGFLVVSPISSIRFRCLGLDFVHYHWLVGFLFQKASERINYQPGLHLVFRQFLLPGIRIFPHPNRNPDLGLYSHGSPTKYRPGYSVSPRFWIGNPSPSSTGNLTKLKSKRCPPAQMMLVMPADRRLSSVTSCALYPSCSAGNSSLGAFIPVLAMY